MDGWRSMGLDVDFLIRQVLAIGFTRAWFYSWARWAWFFLLKSLYLSIYSVFRYITAFSMHPGKQERVDGSGCCSSELHLISIQ